MCRQSDINQKLSHKIDFCVQVVEKYTGIPYIPLESDTKEAKEEEEEEESDKEEEEEEEEEEGDDLK